MTILKHNKQAPLKDNELWQFSLKFYADESNRNSFLFLQEHCNLNINLMLGFLWYAASGRGACTTEQIKQLNVLISPWQTLITQELRVLRKQLEPQKTEFYQAVLASEIYSEKTQQAIIYDFFYAPIKLTGNNQKKAKQGALNLQTYFSICKANLSELGYKHTRHLLSNAFPAFKDFDFPQLSLEL